MSVNILTKKELEKMIRDNDQSVKLIQKNLFTLKQLTHVNSRKWTSSMSSTNTAFSEESTYTNPKQQIFDVEDNFSDYESSELFLD